MYLTVNENTANKRCIFLLSLLLGIEVVKGVAVVIWKDWLVQELLNVENG